MTGPLLAPWRVAWLLTRLRMRRLLNMLGSFSMRNKKKRSGTPSKKRTSLLLTGLLVLAMTLSYGNVAHQAVAHLVARLAETRGDHVFGPALLHVLTVEVALLMLAGVLMTVASRELTQADWDLEWLVTLPAKTATLLWSRIAERTVANTFGMLALWPTCTVLAWLAGFRYSVVAVGFLATLPLLVLTAMAQTLVDTGLRLRLAPARLRNLQAGISVASIVLFYLTISPGMPTGGGFLLRIAELLPDWIRWAPPGLMLQALGATSSLEAATRAMLLIGEVLLLLAAGMWLLRSVLAQGVTAAGSRESGRSKAGAALHRPPQPHGRWTLASPVQRRELTLLARDRNFMVQTLILPVLIVGMQWVMNGRVDSFAEVWAEPQIVAAGVFGVAAYALLLSAFQTLNTEGAALWLLYTFPRSIEAVLRDKARLWGVLALAYPVIGFAFLFVFGPAPNAGTFGLIAMVALGVPIYSAIAVSLGVFGCEPQAVDTRHRVKLTYTYLYILLSALYVGALFAPSWWESLVSMVLAALLALALWQKARDQLPFLLDPVAGPPLRISTADGLIAAMLFFVVQILALASLHWRNGSLQGWETLLAFVVAGAVTYGSVRYAQWRTKVLEVPRMFGARWPQALASGAILGVSAAVLGIAYLQVVHGLGVVEENPPSLRSAGAGSLGVWVLPLGVLAAPLFEEFIFRGLIFGGLRRSMRLLPAAVASAAVFAIVHPPLSMLPVFALGLCAAWSYDGSRLLVAPMLVHAIYNACVIGWQTWVLAPLH